MTKQQLVAAIAAKLSRPKAEVARMLDSLFGAEGLIAAELRRGRKVQLPGFGNFEPRKRKARDARNPRTGRAMSIKDSIAPVFKAARKLKDAVNKKA